ncbi:serine hydrolase [uncultured Algibacter sp.]|uniref:serine hydrolase domain-containing protein n=1 Tax=uncultured Algibacter sp. TaxID=298659 RepID=UPI002602B37F|nr:serine hydrolase domain-containing protein [uncultured Algibacter sp.]
MKQALIIYLFIFFCSNAQNTKFDELDTYIETLAGQNKFMGAVVVSINGKVVYDKQVGYAHISESNKVPITKATKFRIASITKTYTATMVYQLVEEGKLKLSDKLSKYFPQIPNAENISINHMLKHSSGLYEVTKDKDFNIWIRKESTREMMLKRMQKNTSIFEPGSNSEYSNTNFILLGYIIEDIDKRTYANSLKKRIVNTLNLKNTYYGRKIDIANNECDSYEFKNGAFVQLEETHMSNPGGAGAIVASPHDLVAFYDALFTGKLISEKSLEKMLTAKFANYGSGIFVGDSCGHGGGMDGFASEILHKPENKTTVLVISNALGYSITDIGTNAFYASKNKDLLKFITETKAIELTVEQVKACAGDYGGVYGKDKKPFNFTFVAEANMLMGGPNPNMLIPFKAITPYEFVHDDFGIHLKFDFENKTLTFTQAGESHILTKKQ